jgi:hypothetical protein
MNDLDDRLQRLAAEATKDVTPPDVAVIRRRGRRRRVLSRPVLAGTVALVLVLAVVVALAAAAARVGRRPAPLPPRCQRPPRFPPPAGRPTWTAPTTCAFATPQVGSCGPGHSATSWSHRSMQADGPAGRSTR